MVDRSSIVDSQSPKAPILLAWLVHFYTASGVMIAFCSVFLVEQGKFRELFWLMSLAVLIDATDGTLARAARVKELIPSYEGARLDDIVDYLNYVFVPCLFLVRAGLLPDNDALWLAALPLIASAYGFCQKDAKTEDHFFLGFPSYWNVVAFYFFVLRTPPWLNAFLLIFFSILVFVPLRYLYPSRSPVLRSLTLALASVWGILILLLIYQVPEPDPILVWASLVFPVYYLALSFWLDFRNRQLGG